MVYFLTAPCTSAATERIFSLHGNIHNVKRNRLTTERVAKPAYISYNWNLLLNQRDEEVEDEEEPISNSLDVSPLTIPTFIVTEPQPSTSGNNTRDIEFFDLGTRTLSYDSDKMCDIDFLNCVLSFSFHLLL